MGAVAAQSLMTRRSGRTAILHVADDARTRLHALPMRRLLVPLDGELEILTPRGSTRHRGPTWTSPGLECAIHNRGRMLSLFVDPDGPSLDASAERISGAARELVSLERDGAGLLDELSRSEAPRRLDPRLERALERLREDPTAPWSMATLSTELGLSRTRLAYLFKTELGVSARSFALLGRCIWALAAHASGQPGTAAAHAAGFSDQAHFSRSCARLFGQTPSTIRDGKVAVSEAGWKARAAGERPMGARETLRI